MEGWAYLLAGDGIAKPAVHLSSHTRSTRHVRNMRKSNSTTIVIGLSRGDDLFQLGYTTYPKPSLGVMRTARLLHTAATAAAPLAGRNAIVTGSTSGIGLGVATVLAARGASVVLNGFGDAAPALVGAASDPLAPLPSPDARCFVFFVTILFSDGYFRTCSCVSGPRL